MAEATSSTTSYSKSPYQVKIKFHLIAVISCCGLSSLTDKNDLAWWKVYEFVDNRMRSVRQDLVIQVYHPSYKCSNLSIT